jgi:site-specific recombinase XerD
MLRELQRNTAGAFVFEKERRGPFTADAVNRLVKTIGARAKLPFRVHAHMLRHASGYALANAGHDTRLIQDWLGHRAIQHTARYTELSPTRFIHRLIVGRHPHDAVQGYTARMGDKAKPLRLTPRRLCCLRAAPLF